MQLEGFYWHVRIYPWARTGLKWLNFLHFNNNLTITNTIY
jgi:hypothetical protein